MMAVKGFVQRVVLITVFITSFAQAQQSDNTEKIRYVNPLHSRAGTSVGNGTKYECFKCNRYKGHGTQCPETREQLDGPDAVANAPFGDTIVKGCDVCLKVKTVYRVRNRNYIVDKMQIQTGQPPQIEYTIISRTCIEEKEDARLLDGCITETAVGGYVQRCYCQGQLCNDSNNCRASPLFLLTLIFISYSLSRLFVSF